MFPRTFSGAAQSLPIGLPGGEAHRLDSYISQIGIAWEQLTAIKEYRTPQALRALFLSMSVDVS